MVCVRACVCVRLCEVKEISFRKPYIEGKSRAIARWMLVGFIFLVLFSYHHMHLSLSIPINMCGILFNILSVFSRFVSRFIPFMCKCVRVRVCVNFRMCLNVCVWMSVVPLNIWCSRWLLFVAGERDATNVWLAQYLCTVFISTVFFSINFSIRSKPFLSLPRSIFSIPIFFWFCCCWSFWWEIRENYSNFFPLIFSLSRFCFQKASNSMSLSLYLSCIFTYSVLLLSATHKTEWCERYKWNDVPSFSFYLSAAVGFVCECVCIFFTCFWLFLSYLILL